MTIRVDQAARWVSVLGMCGMLLGGCRAMPAPSPAAAPAEDRPAPEEAYFEFETLPGDRMVFKLTEPERIKEAREILSKNLRKHVNGVIVKSPRTYAGPWSFHLEPRSIGFSVITDPSCDGAIRFVEEQLSAIGKTVLPDLQWCPSSSRLTKELPPPVSR